MEMVIVFVLTAPAGGVVGLLGDADDDDELEFELQAPMAHAAATTVAMHRVRGFTVFIPPLDSTGAAASHRRAFLVAGTCSSRASRLRCDVDAAEHRRRMYRAVIAPP